jgi:hypothetical protein
MANISWIATGSGNWSNAANWSGGTEPGAADDVLLSGANAYTVTFDVADTIRALTISDAAAALVLDQLLTLKTTLAVSAGSLQIEGGGGISGGVLAIGAAGSATLNGGSLSDVRLQGTLVVTDAGGVLSGTIDGAGVGGTGTGVIDYNYGNFYAANYLYAEGNTTLNGDTMNIGNTGTGGSVNILFAQDTAGTGATLTFGKSFVLNEVAGNSALQGSDGAKDRIINDGTIDAVTGGGALQIDATRFLNNGVIDTANGGVVFFTGTMSAALLDSVTIGAGGYAGIDGTVKGGTLVTPDGQIGSWGGSGELDSVAVQGTLTVQDGGFTLTGRNSFAGTGGSGTGTLNFTQGNYYSDNYLFALGSQTLDNVALNIGNTGLGGSVNILYNQDGADTGAVLTLGPAFTLNAVAGNSAIQSSDGSKDDIVNEGTIDATTGGGYLQIDATKFTNKGTIDTANGGLVYFTGAIAASLLDSVTTGTGGYAGIDGTVTGGTLVTPDGQIGSWGGSGVLDGVAVHGTLTIQDSGFTLEGKNTFADTDDQGDATLNFDLGSYYSDNDLTILGNETLNDMVLNIGNTGLGGSTNILFDKDTTGEGATLILGKNFTLNAVAGNSAIAGTDASADRIINEGTINASTNGDSLDIDATKFVNDGIISTSNGGLLVFTGTIAASLIDSVFTGVPPMGSTNTTAYGYVGIDGAVNGGTITTSDGQVGSYGSNGVLDDVAVHGTFTVEDSTFTLIGHDSFAGLSGSGLGTLDFDLGNYYSDNYLDAQGDITLSNVQLNMGNTGLGGSSNILFNQDKTGTNATLTLGSSFILDAVAGNSGIAGTDGAHDAIVNEGTIEAETKGGVLTIDATRFTNKGVIDVSKGGEIIVTGPTAASLIDSISVGVGGFVGIDGIVTGGTLVCGSTGIGAAGSSGGLDGVAVQGTLDLESGSFSIAGNTSFAGKGGTGAGTVDFDYGSVEQADYLYVQGGATLSNVVVNIGNTGEGSTNILYNDDTSGTGATLTLGSSFTLNLIAGGAGIGGSGGAGDAVINDGTINAKSSGVLQIRPANFTNNGAMTASGSATIVIATDFTDVAAGTLSGGTITIDAGGTIDFANNSNVATIASGLTLSGAGSVLQWFDTTTNSEQSFDSAFTTLEAGATLSLLAGRDLTTTNAVTDNGKLVLGGGTLTAASIAVGAAASLTGSGTIAAPLSLATKAVLSAEGGTLAVMGNVSGSGYLIVGSDASLTIAGNASAQSASVAAGGTLAVAGSVGPSNIVLDASGDTLALGTASSVAAKISGFGSGDTIDITSQSLGSVIWTQTSSSGGSLQLIGSAGSIGTLTLAGSYTQANFAVASDVHHIDFVTQSAVADPVQTASTAAAMTSLHDHAANIILFHQAGFSH